MDDSADRAATGTLAERHDVAMLDLDGVVYIGGEAVPGAANHLAAAREAGLQLAFITNNASRPPRAVADLLTELGVPAAVEDVVTSAQAAARVLLERLGAGARVALLGGEGLRGALAAAGLEAVPVDAEADAVVSGYGPDVVWSEVMRAATRIRQGLWWVASNTDGTIPTAYGVAPGHGVLVDTLRRFTGIEPVVAGKPARPLLEETVRRTGAERPLMVGDRLDTDIAGARSFGIDSLLVMTGVTDLAALCSAAPQERPTRVAADLGGLLEPLEAPARDGDGWALGGWRIREDGGDGWAVEGQDSASRWWQLVAAYVWERADRTGRPVDPEAAGVTPPSVGGDR